MRLVVGLFFLFALSVHCQKHPDWNYEFESESSESFESDEVQDRVASRVQEQRKLMQNFNNENGGAGRDTYNSYKSVCIVDGKPKLVDMFDCRNQVPYQCSCLVI